MKDILQEITRLRTLRRWSEYQLAQASGITQSTISTWYSNGSGIRHYPVHHIDLVFQTSDSIQSLNKVCKGFGITLSQFFAEGNDPISLTEEQRKLLDDWATLSPQKKQLVRELIKSL